MDGLTPPPRARTHTLVCKIQAGKRTLALAHKCSYTRACVCANEHTHTHTHISAPKKAAVSVQIVKRCATSCASASRGSGLFSSFLFSFFCLSIPRSPARSRSRPLSRARTRSLSLAHSLSLTHSLTLVSLCRASHLFWGLWGILQARTRFVVLLVLFLNYCFSLVGLCDIFQARARYMCVRVLGELERARARLERVSQVRENLTYAAFLTHT